MPAQRSKGRTKRTNPLTAPFGETSTRVKLQLIAVIIVSPASGGFLLWLALSAFLPMLAASAARAPGLEVRAEYAAGVPLAVACFCFALLGLLARPDPPRTRSGFVRTTKLQDAVFGTVLICMVLVPLARPIGRSVVSDVMTSRDYRTCPHPHPWRGPTRWVRTAVPCPDAAGG